MPGNVKRCAPPTIYIIKNLRSERSGRRNVKPHIFRIRPRRGIAARRSAPEEARLQPEPPDASRWKTPPKPHEKPIRGKNFFERKEKFFEVPDGGDKSQFYSTAYLAARQQGKTQYFALQTYREKNKKFFEKSVDKSFKGWYINEAVADEGKRKSRTDHPKSLEKPSKKLCTL